MEILSEAETSVRRKKETAIAMPKLNMKTVTPNTGTIRRNRSGASQDVASAYDHVGNDYGRYADGQGLADPSGASANRFAHADTIVWNALRSTIDQLHRVGVPMLRVLDAGCGPGTWLRRIATHARQFGFSIKASGVDISRRQLEIARKQVEKLEAREDITFLVHDLAGPLPWADGCFHIVLCNYVVLNHLPRVALPRVVKELCRVTSHRVIATVRALGSPPTGCIIGTEQVREYHQDCGRGKLRLVLNDGTKHRLTLNLYSAETIKAVFAEHAQIGDLRAIDLFASRFAPDADWTGALVNTLPGRDEVLRKLTEMEEPLCREPGWIDHGTHILIVAQPKRLSASKALLTP